MELIIVTIKYFSLAVYILFICGITDTSSADGIFFKEPEDKQIKEGANLTLSCRTRIPVIKVEWEKVYKSSITLIKTIYHTFNNNWDYKIYSVSYSWHNVKMRCKAYYNERSSTSREATILVLAPPRNVSIFYEGEMLLEKTIFLFCNATGYPPPNFLWIDSTLNVVGFNQTYTFKIEKILLKFECLAQNEIYNEQFQASGDIEIIAQGKPYLKSSKSFTSIEEGKEAHFVVTYCSNPEPRLSLWNFSENVISGFSNVDKYKSSRKELELFCFDDELIISKVSRKDESEYVFQVENDYGELIVKFPKMILVEINRMTLYITIGITVGLLVLIVFGIGLMKAVKYCPDTKGVVLDTSGFFYESHINCKNSLKTDLYHSIIDSNIDSEPIRLDVTLLHELGKGHFGKNYKGKLKEANHSEENCTFVAVKLLQDISDQNINNEFLKEIQNNQKISYHKNIVPFLGIYDSPDKLGIVLEFLPRGNLKSLLRDKYTDMLLQCLNEKLYKSLSREIINFAKMIAEGLDYIHKHKIIHRELSARHILIDSNNNCKISDFRCSLESSEPNQYRAKNEKEIPVRWLAPEVLFYNYYTIKSEIWSYGIVLWEIVTLGSAPYPRMKEATQVVDALRGHYRMELPKHCPIDLYTVMTECWKNDAFERPLTDKILLSLKTIRDNKAINCNFQCYEHQVYQTLDSDIYKEFLSMSNEEKVLEDQ